MGVLDKKKKDTAKAAPAKKAVEVAVTTEEWFRELKDKKVTIGGVEFEVTKVAGRKAELTRTNYR